ncbi:hypothetical protein [Amycolatopsis sp. cmx-4-61]|uniref:hypothetical protein n=1 Tax=Amycolatopsis sp. cmx-4-61 TaxID=2790937 RepID=UPI00397E6B49
MTKTEKQRIARRARRYGYSRSDTDLSVNCPECHEKVSTRFSRDAGTIIRQLDAAMFVHLDLTCVVHNPDASQEIGGS